MENNNHEVIRLRDNLPLITFIAILSGLAFSATKYLFLRYKAWYYNFNFGKS